MKFKVLSYLLIPALAAISCVKSKNDLGGMREDEGSIVVSVIETGVSEASSHGAGEIPSFTNFDFSTPNEEVKFFNIHISQPRSRKVSGNLKVKIALTNGTGGTPIPAGAITIPTEISIPGSNAPEIDFPVKFQVNKGLLDPTVGDYIAHFTITGADQGSIVSSLEDEIDVTLQNGRYLGRYQATITVRDSANRYSSNNVKPVVFFEDGFGGITWFDYYGYYNSPNLANAIVYGFNNVIRTISTGAMVQFMYPGYQLDASGKVTGMYNNQTGVAYNVTFTSATANKFTITSNDQRSFEISYTLRATLGGLNQPFTVTEKYAYDPLQMWWWF
jgi:hypothetical protein